MSSPSGFVRCLPERSPFKAFFKLPASCCSVWGVLWRTVAQSRPGLGQQADYSRFWRRQVPQELSPGFPAALAPGHGPAPPAFPDLGSLPPQSWWRPPCLSLHPALPRQARMSGGQVPSFLCSDCVQGCPLCIFWSGWCRAVVLKLFDLRTPLHS